MLTDGSDRHDRARSIHDDVDAEIDSHFEGTVDLLMSRGMTAVEARAEAKRRFGDVAEHRARIERIDRRRHRRRRWSAGLETTWSHVAMAFRAIRRSPGFATAVVLILGLGIGANVTIFEVMDRLLLSPPAYVRDADQVRRLFVNRVGFNGRPTTSDYLTYPDFEDFTRVEAFQQTAAYTRPRSVTLGSGQDAAPVRKSTATWSLFPLLGVRPAAGRFYTEEEDVVGAREPVVVLSHAFWKRRFGADAGVLGRSLRIGRASYTVIGVAPEGFTGVGVTPIDVWVPLRPDDELTAPGDRCMFNRQCWWLQIVGRLAPGVAPRAAEARATAAFRAARAETVDYDPGARILTASLIPTDWPEDGLGPGRATGRAGEAGPDAATVSRWLGGVSLIVLMVACANVANLLLARSARRRREIAVRKALGVGWGRLLGEIFTESLVLASLAAAVALLLSSWGGRTVRAVFLPDVAFGGVLAPRPLAFAAVAAVVTALAAGLGPAFQAGRADTNSPLRTGPGRASTPRSGARTALLVAQTALSVVLLVGAGLFVRSARAVMDVDLGFSPDDLYVVRPEMEAGLSQREGLALYDRALERLRLDPTVLDATYTTMGLPFGASTSYGAITVAGRDSVPTLPSGGPYIFGVSPGFFSTMGIGLLEGRGFTDADREDGEPVAVVNRTFARTVWPEGGSLGACILLHPDRPPCLTVVGIVEDSHREQVLNEEPQMMYYVPARQVTWSASVQGIVVRVAPRVGAAAHLRALLADLDPAVRYVDVQPFASRYADQLRPWVLGATLFSVFGILALLVAAVGLYSVLAFSVAERRYEMGIRSALGATRARIVRLVMSRAVALAGAGLAIGGAAALLMAHAMRALLYGVSATDPFVYGGVVVTLICVAVLAALLPARRAVRVDPSEALRAE